MIEDYIDLDHDSIPHLNGPCMNVQWAVLESVGNNSREIVGLFASGHERELELMLKSSDNLSVINLYGKEVVL